MLNQGLDRKGDFELALKSYTAQGSAKVPMPRVCRNCGHSWVTCGTVTSLSNPLDFLDPGRNQGTKEQAEAVLQKVLEKKASRFLEQHGSTPVTYGAVCPSCHEVSTEARERYFLDGYRSSILTCARRFWIACFLGIPLLFATSAVLSYWTYLTFDEFRMLLGTNKPVTHAGASALFMIVFAIFSLLSFGCTFLCCASALRMPSIMKKLQALSESEAKTVIVKEYEKKEGSLSFLSGFTWIQSLVDSM